MIFNVENLSLACPEQFWIKAETETLEAIWNNVKVNQYSHDAAKERAYLNQLCLDLLIPELEEESDLNLTWTGQPYLWEFVTGIALEVEQIRLILIPSLTLDTDEFVVPQEWVDIPSWSGDYYLAVEINLPGKEPIEADKQGGWLRVWGFTTHRQLKTQGSYDSIMRTYELDAAEVEEDLNALWTSIELELSEKAEIEPLSILEQEQFETLLQELATPSVYSPRLKKSFPQWGAILEDKEKLEQLYQARICQVYSGGITTPVTASFGNKIDNTLDTLATNLNQLLDNLLGTETQWQPMLVGSTRSIGVRGISQESGHKVRKIVTFDNHNFSLVNEIQLFQQGYRTRITVCLKLYGDENRNLPEGIKLILEQGNETRIFKTIDQKTKWIGFKESNPPITIQRELTVRVTLEEDSFEANFDKAQLQEIVEETNLQETTHLGWERIIPHQKEERFYKEIRLGDRRFRLVNKINRQDDGLETKIGASLQLCLDSKVTENYLPQGIKLILNHENETRIFEATEETMEWIGFSEESPPIAIAKELIVTVILGEQMIEERFFV